VSTEWSESREQENVTHLTLLLVGLLGPDDLRRVPDEAAHSLHPVQVFLVEHLFSDGENCSSKLDL